MSEPRYTIEDVAKHNGHENSRTWIIIKDFIYDVTDYLEKHPGGRELLTEYAGKDGTAAFDDFGHSSDAKTTIKSYRIGQLAEEERTGNKIRTDGSMNKLGSRNVETRKNRRTFFRVVCGGCV